MKGNGEWSVVSGRWPVSAENGRVDRSDDDRLMGGEGEASWSEENSQEFIDYGRYFVPERETQMAIINRLMPAG